MELSIVIPHHAHVQLVILVVIVVNVLMDITRIMDNVQLAIVILLEAKVKFVI